MFEKIFFIYLAVINIIAFIMYGLDKAKAIAGKWRTTEFALIVVSAIGGCLGAFIGMRVWHHKTQKLKFQILVPLFLIIWVVIIMRLKRII